MNYKFPLQSLQKDNGACDDPECCGGRQEWYDLVDAEGVVIFDGRSGSEENLAIIEKAFRTLAIPVPGPTP